MVINVFTGPMLFTLHFHTVHIFAMIFARVILRQNKMSWNHVCRLTNAILYLIPGSRVVFKSSYRLITIILKQKLSSLFFWKYIQIQIRFRQINCFKHTLNITKKLRSELTDIYKRMNIP